jgi:hypothetical protein
MTLNSFYGINLPLTLNDIVEQEKRHIRVLLLKRLLQLKDKNGQDRTGKSGMVRTSARKNNS